MNSDCNMTPITDALKNLDPQQHLPELNQIIFDGLAKVRDAARDVISSIIPYRHYPVTADNGKVYRSSYHESGMLRGKQYGKLADDVKRSASKDASGGSVSIYSQKSDTRWCVLWWLNAGTLQRTTGGRTRIRKNGTTQFSENGGRQGNRGSIEAQNFFLPAAQGGVGAAESYITNEACNLLNSQIND